MPDAHLSDEQLARFQDGELPASQAAHLDQCAECAGRLRDSNVVAAAYAEYRDSIRGPSLPPPPRPWQSLDRLVASRQGQRRLSYWWWVPAAATLAAVVLLFWPTPQADRLLAQSAGAELPSDGMISLRAHGRTLLRAAVLSSESPSGPEMAQLQTLFEGAHYGWREPLSSRTFQTWRQAQHDRRDSVTSIGGPGDARLYRVRTDVPGGVLRAASLTLRARDLRATAGDFDFGGQGSVSMERAAALVEAGAAQPSPKVAPPVETPVGPADTLRVLAALDDIGADAGEPIELSEDAGHRRVVVHAGALPVERQQQIAAALAPLPRVRLDLEAQPRLAPPPASTGSQTFTSNVPAALRQRFEERLGGPVAVQEATDRVLESSAQALARAHALEVLARHFPPETEGRLSPSEQALLRRLRVRHLDELARLAAQIHGAVQPLLAGAWPSGENGRAAIWQEGVPGLVASARETDQLLNRLLAGSYSQSSGEEMLRQLPATLQQLERTIRSQARGE